MKIKGAEPYLFFYFLVFHITVASVYKRLIQVLSEFHCCICNQCRHRIAAGFSLFCFLFVSAGSLSINMRLDTVKLLLCLQTEVAALELMIYD